jgi:hypothetical protein
LCLFHRKKTLVPISSSTFFFQNDVDDSAGACNSTITMLFYFFVILCISMQQNMSEQEYNSCSQNECINVHHQSFNVVSSSLNYVLYTVLFNNHLTIYLPNSVHGFNSSCINLVNWCSILSYNVVTFHITNNWAYLLCSKIQVSIMGPNFYPNNYNLSSTFQVVMCLIYGSTWRKIIYLSLWVHCWNMWENSVKTLNTNSHIRWNKFVWIEKSGSPILDESHTLVVFI